VGHKKLKNYEKLENSQYPQNKKIESNKKFFPHTKKSIDFCQMFLVFIWNCVKIAVKSYLFWKKFLLKKIKLSIIHTFDGNLKNMKNFMYEFLCLKSLAFGNLKSSFFLFNWSLFG
jgi:hypothetical protein